jgi:hypothetical protein
MLCRGRGHSSGMEQRANNKFCFKQGKTATETVELMRQVYGDNCLSRAQIFRWYARFKSGVETTEDEARPERPFSVRNEGPICLWFSYKRCQCFRLRSVA